MPRYRPKQGRTPGLANEQTAALNTRYRAGQSQRYAPVLKRRRQCLNALRYIIKLDVSHPNAQRPSPDGRVQLTTVHLKLPAVRHRAKTQAFNAAHHRIQRGAPRENSRHPQRNHSTAVCFNRLRPCCGGSRTCRYYGGSRGGTGRPADAPRGELVAAAPQELRRHAQRICSALP